MKLTRSVLLAYLLIIGTCNPIYAPSEINEYEIEDFLIPSPGQQYYFTGIPGRFFLEILALLTEAMQCNWWKVKQAEIES